jgi:hypothetical protein
LPAFFLRVVFFFADFFFAVFFLLTFFFAAMVEFFQLLVTPIIEQVTNDVQ